MDSIREALINDAREEEERLEEERELKEETRTIINAEDFHRSYTILPIQLPETMHQTGFKNKAGRTQDFPLYTQERIILDMQNKDIQLHMGDELDFAGVLFRFQ